MLGGRTRVLVVRAVVLIAACSASFSSAAQECRDTTPGARTKIVGGNRARLEHWPGQAVLRLHAKGARNSLYLCGGTVINERWVLTAAHCVDDIRADLRKTFPDRQGRNQAGVLDVVLGVGDLDEVRDEHVFAIENILKREGYKEAAKSGRDIALIQLKRPYAGPVPRLSLAAGTDPATPPGAQVRVAGFGSLKFSAPMNSYKRADGQEYLAGSPQLLETAIPTVSQSACKARYPSAKIDDEQLCAGMEQGGQDSCQGDSGGPLVAYDRNGCPYQIGVVSWGAGCAGARDYGVYTRVSQHAAWIQSQAGVVRAVALADLQPQRADAVPNAFTQQARSQLEDILATAKGRVRIGVKGGNRVKLGSDVVFAVHSNVAGRLIVIDVNASGEVTQILPNKYTPAHSSALVAAGSDLTVPGIGYGFSGFRAVEPPGKGQLIALVVPEGFPADSLVNDKERIAKGFAPVNTPTSYLMNLVQQVSAFVGRRRSDDPQMKDWGLGTADYEIIK